MTLGVVKVGVSRVGMSVVVVAVVLVVVVHGVLRLRQRVVPGILAAVLVVKGRGGGVAPRATRLGVSQIGMSVVVGVAVVVVVPAVVRLPHLPVAAAVVERRGG